MNHIEPFIFSTWTGACSGSTCTVTMTNNKTVTAVYSAQETKIKSVTIGSQVSVIPAKKVSDKK